jgi:hypothetical protein
LRTTAGSSRPLTLKVEPIDVVDDPNRALRLWLKRASLALSEAETFRVRDSPRRFEIGQRVAFYKGGMTLRGTVQGVINGSFLFIKPDATQFKHIPVPIENVRRLVTKKRKQK